VQSADEKAIDRFYKRLSIKFHPDKARPDPAKNETLETVNDRWVEMTKAYKALTDEEIRNNFLQFGHPDGKQSFSIGIALPKGLVAAGSGPYVLLFYGLLLGVLLPYFVGKWWYGTQALTKEKVLLASAGKLFREYKDDMSAEQVVSFLSAGDEFKEVFPGKKANEGLAKVERTVATQSTISEAEKARLRDVEDDVQRKSLTLLWAYLDRIDLGDQSLNDEKYEVAPVALRLNDSMSAITLAFGNVASLLSSYHASQSLIQAMHPSASPVLQLPHFTPAIAKALSGSNSKSPLTIQKLMALPASIRRSLCGDLSDTQFSQAMIVASQIPHLQVAKAFFKVQGDRVITPSSLVQLVVKARFIPLGTQNISPINELDLEDIDPDEDDVNALLGRKQAKTTRRKDADGKVIEEKSEKETVLPPLAHAPYFARDHSPRWHIFLSDPRAGKIAVPPFTFTAFDKPILGEDGKPTFNVQTLKCQFAAPPAVGAFNFVMNVICDSYVGMDTKYPITLDVRDVSEANAVESEEEISEPDEGTFPFPPSNCTRAKQAVDSLAGQIQAMKTGVAAPPAKKKIVRKKAPAVEEDDDESDTDGEVDDDTSETDTDTESEGE
jgi:translocation protein SEC63